jgi:plastocyanin
MLRRLLLFALPAVVLSTSLVACSSGGDDKGTAAPAAPAATTAPAASETAPPTAAPEAQGDVVSLISEDPGGSGKYQFNPKELTFKLGQTVTFQLKAESEFHTVQVDALGIDEALNAGETRSITVTFNKAGEFRLYCIPHEALGMVGKITVLQ